MKSIYDETYRAGDYIPVVHAYYDRADMLATTVEEANHAHTLSEIMYVNEGAIEVETCGKREAIGEKQFIWLDASVKHHLILSGDMPCSVMNIEFQLEALAPRVPSFKSLCRMDGALEAMMGAGAAYLVLTDADGALYNLMKQIIQLADSTHPEAEALCSWLTSQVLVIIARLRDRAGRRGHTPIRNNYVAAAVAYIDAHYLEPLTATQIAQTLHVQATYLHRLFKEHMGMTIGEYIGKLRIREAKALLAETDRTQLEIAVGCGFSSQQRFTELFRRHMGEAPSAYRNRHKKER